MRFKALPLEDNETNEGSEPTFVFFVSFCSMIPLFSPVSSLTFSSESTGLPFRAPGREAVLH
jgi:hypothetical protein